MTDKQFVLTTMRDTGLARAQTLQAQALDMTGTELYASEDYIPNFTAACEAMNMLERKAGFVCRSEQDNNVWEPGSVGVKWEGLGEVSNG